MAKETWGEVPHGSSGVYSPGRSKLHQPDLRQGDRWTGASVHVTLAGGGRGTGSGSPGMQAEVTDLKFKVGASPGSA